MPGHPELMADEYIFYGVKCILLEDKTLGGKRKVMSLYLEHELTAFKKYGMSRVPGIQIEKIGNLMLT